MNAFKAAIKRKPDYEDAHYNLGCAHFALGRSIEASVCFREAVRPRPDRDAAWQQLGRSVMSLMLVDDAIAAFRAAPAAGAEPFRTELNIGICELTKGELATGFAHYEARLSRPDHQPRHEAIHVCGRVRRSRDGRSWCMRSRALATRSSACAICRCWPIPART